MSELLPEQREKLQGPEEAPCSPPLLFRARGIHRYRARMSLLLASRLQLVHRVHHLPLLLLSLLMLLRLLDKQ